MVKKLIPIFVVVFLLGCAATRTSLKQYSGLDEKISARDFSGAIAKIEKAKDKYYTAKDKVVYYLDLGMLYHYQGNFSKSTELLTKAENAIDENYTRSISKAAVSMLLNDNVLDYAGEDYEDIYLNIFKALNYLEMDKFDDSFVEIRKINNKLNLLEDKYRKLGEEYEKTEDNKAKFKPAENKFHNDALARYLSMLLYRAEGKQDDARIDLQGIKNAWKDQTHIYNFSMPALDNHLVASDKAKVNFVCYTGKSPVKEAKTLYIHTEKNIIIVATTERKPDDKTTVGYLGGIPWEGVEKGYHFKFQLPFIKERDSCVNRVSVTVDDLPAYDLELIEDVGVVAVETYKVKEPLIYVKTIARTIIKGLFAEKRKEEMEKKIENPVLGFVARLATDAAVDATENADLRISRFFPDRAYVGELEIAAGVHKITVNFYSANGGLLFTDQIDAIDIKNDKLNLIRSYYLN